MKEFFKTKTGRAITTGLATMVIWAICTPIFDLLFRGGIKEFDLFRYIIEPILIGVGVGVLEYFFEMSKKRENRKKRK